MKIKLKAILTAAALMMSVFPQSISAQADISVGDYIRLGEYNNKPIIWRYAGSDDNGKLMFADNIICYKSFDAAERGNDNRSRSSSGSNLWSESTVRYWLNSDAEQVDYAGNPPTAENVWLTLHSYDQEPGFLTSFTAEEKQAIKTVTLKTPLNGLDAALSDGTYTTTIFDPELNKSEVETEYQCTTDKIFLLDCEQLDMVINNFNDDFYCTSVLPASEHMADSTMNLQYFLRTPNLDGEWAPDRVFSVTVNNEKVLPIDLFITAYMSIGIRPAFYLNEDAYITGGDGTSANPYTVSAQTSSGADGQSDIAVFPKVIKNGDDYEIHLEWVSPSECTMWSFDSLTLMSGSPENGGTVYDIIGGSTYIVSDSACGPNGIIMERISKIAGSPEEIYIAADNLKAYNGEWISVQLNPQPVPVE